MKVRRIVRSGADRAPALDALERLVDRAGALHQLEDARAGVLERDVEVRQQLAVGHQRDDVVDVRIRIDVVQARPHAEFATGLRTAPSCASGTPCRASRARRTSRRRRRRRCPARSPAVRLHAAHRELLGFAQHLVDRARHQVAAHRRDDAEAAAVVAAFGNLQVRVVLRRQLDAVVAAPGRGTGSCVGGSAACTALITLA